MIKKKKNGEVLGLYLPGGDWERVGSEGGGVRGHIMQCREQHLPQQRIARLKMSPVPRLKNPADAATVGPGFSGMDTFPSILIRVYVSHWSLANVPSALQYPEGHCPLCLSQRGGICFLPYFGACFPPYFGACFPLPGLFSSLIF